MEDQAAIVSYLRENKIPYRLDPSANAILMPRGQVYETRLSLAQEGLPRGGSKGFERRAEPRSSRWLAASPGRLVRLEEAAQQGDVVEVSLCPGSRTWT